MGDIRDATAVTEAMAHVDGFIHLAACLGTQETIQNPYPAAETNLLGGLNILQAAAQYHVPGAYIAVGNFWMDNPYSITKNMIERFVAMYNKERDTRINVVRAVNAYGPRQLAAAPFGPGKVRKITPALICRALCDMDMELYGGGIQTSDMVWVGDVAGALVRALQHADQNDVINKAIEIGPSVHRSVYEVAELVRDICADCTGSAVGIKSLPMRPGEDPNAKVQADNTTLELIGIKATELMTLKDGMEQTVAWFWKNKGITWFDPSTDRL